jgi:hypothetical protein
MKIYVDTKPYWHAIIDDFLIDPDPVAREFPAQDDKCWFRYDNPLEIKQTCNHYDRFGKETYKTFTYFSSSAMLYMLESLTECSLIPDIGLHGGGLDYNMHPKLPLQRRLNLIVYLTPNWQEDWGGHLGLYKDPDNLVKTVAPIYNRAVIFDTRGSWHGLPEPIDCPQGVTRNSLAMYYLCEPDNTDNRSRALFAPTKDQKQDPYVARLIQNRCK